MCSIHLPVNYSCRPGSRDGGLLVVLVAPSLPLFTMVKGKSVQNCLDIASKTMATVETNLNRNSQAAALKEIMEHLEANLQEIILTRDLLKAGVMGPESRAAKEDEIPHGTSRVRHLSMKFIGEMITLMNPKISLAVLKHMAKLDPKVALKLFQMGTLTELNDPIFSHNKADVVKHYVAIHRALKEPLKNMTWSSEYKIDWAKSGVFTLVSKGGGDSDRYTHFVHVTGAEVELPGSVQLSSADTMTWTSNWSQKESFVKNGHGTMQSPSHAFQQAGIKLTQASDCEAPLGAVEEKKGQQCEALEDAGAGVDGDGKSDAAASARGEPCSTVPLHTPQKCPLPRLAGAFASGGKKVPRVGTPPADGEGL